MGTRRRANPAAATVLAGNLASLPVQGRTWAVVGVLGDKDAPGIGAALRTRLDGYVAVDLSGDRARSAVALGQAFASTLGAPVFCAPSVESALNYVRSLAQGGDRVIVFGSFHVVGPALEWLRLYLKGWS